MNKNLSSFDPKNVARTGKVLEVGKRKVPVDDLEQIGVSTDWPI